MHVDPSGTDKAFIMLFNPTLAPMTKTLTIPLYYTGMKGTATFMDDLGANKKYTLGVDHNIQITVTIPASGYKWMVIR
jgi:hypothetical protein